VKGVVFTLEGWGQRIKQEPSRVRVVSSLIHTTYN